MSETTIFHVFGDHKVLGTSEGSIFDSIEAKVFGPKLISDNLTKGRLNVKT